MEFRRNFPQQISPNELPNRVKLLCVWWAIFEVSESNMSQTLEITTKYIAHWNGWNKLIQLKVNNGSSLCKKCVCVCACAVKSEPTAHKQNSYIC